MPRSTHRYDWKRDRRSHPAVRTLRLRDAGLIYEPVDLREKCPPVDDQGAEGSCTANAGVGLAEFDLLRQGLAPEQLSRAFLYWTTRNLEGTDSDDSGATIADTVQAWAKFGICPEADMPYIAGDVASRPGDQAFADAAPDVAQNYAQVEQSLPALYACLAAGFPVIFGLDVYESFEDAAAGNIPRPNTDTEQFLGGHAILLVGYDPVRKIFIFRNSWGDSWGDAGYGTLPEKYVLDPDLASDFWAVRGIGASSPLPAPPEPSNGGGSQRGRRGIVQSGFLEHVGDDSPLWQIADALEAAGDEVIRLEWTDSARPALNSGPVDYWLNYSWGKAQTWQTLKSYPSGTAPGIGVEITIAGVACWLFGQCHGVVWHEYPNIARAINFTVTSVPISDPIRDAGTVNVGLGEAIPGNRRVNVNCDRLGLNHVSIAADGRVQKAILEVIGAITP